MKIDSPQWKHLIGEGAKTFGIALNDHQLQQFSLHATELLKWNCKVNLTAITDPFEVGIKHFLDSLIPSVHIPPGARLLDIGSGGGFPGIPLKILIPDLAVTLLDASRKKISFLKHVIRTLHLEGIDARHGRAELLARNAQFIRSYDVIVSRALGALWPFVRMGLPMLSKQGMMMAFKGKVAPEELGPMRRFPIEGEHAAQPETDRLELLIRSYKLPLLELERSVVLIRYRSDTSRI